MKSFKTGIVLYTINYNECVEFYQKILELEKLFNNNALTCFRFGESYLMVEIANEYKTPESENFRIRTCLRMNVHDVKTIAKKLMSKDVEVDYQEHSWGTVAKFLDPDGNLCAFRDSASFEKQIDTKLNP